MKKYIDYVIKLIVWCWNSSVMRYIFFGGCTTLVNLGTYYILRLMTNLNMNIANTISVIAAILFAYFVNSKFVFESKAESLKEQFEEFVKFISARAVTMVIEVGGLWLLADIMHMNDYIAKFLIQFIVLALNYVFSKFLIFTKKEDK